MYLSRLKLDEKNRKTLAAFANPAVFHGAIETSFPGERKRRLWRIDRLAGSSYIMIVSDDEPRLDDAAIQFGSPKFDPKFEIRVYDPLLRRIENGTKWRFRLCANPTYSVSKGGERGRVCAHTTTEHQREWLIRQSEKHGFSLTDGEFDIVEKDWRMFQKGSGKNRVTLLAVTYEGILEVSDAELFKDALINGIGRGKAYGMGMLTVMNARGE